MDIKLSTATVADLTGASVRQIGYWTDSRILKPSGQAASGKGTRRRYTFQDLVAIKAVFRLRERGCPLQAIRKTVRYLRQHYPSGSDAQMLSSLTLLTDGKAVYMLTDEHAVMDVLKRQHVWAVPLGLVIREAREQVRALPAEWTEAVKVDGRTYHLRVLRDGETDTYTVQCRELPGAIEQGDSVREAIANGKAAIRSVHAFAAKRKAATGGRHVEAG